ncbi:MmgE/PrpD family protein [Rhizomonospora bruguierae]|uniref:MmgE/PrpD family protein n=1 Tax=Rhizomonospora bruguierae TaxID=1581705 RepID=UPI001BCA8491|nr:MmgE/PrpD family protein [Micromonospora sp. NBRC 107566]
MDPTTRRIVDFALGLSFADLPDEVVREASMRVFDTVGCALATRDAEPVRITLATLGAGGDGRVIGRPDLRLPPDAAAFVNTTMIRYLDFNDWAPNGHPSDVVGAFLALADRPGVDGRRLVTATVAAYEVFIGLTEASKLPRLGWDQGFALGIAAVAGIGNLLGIDAAAVGNAVGIMAAAGIPTGASRSGELSMWKGCATAYATRNAVFATLLARAGLTGPPAAFEGRRGIFPLVTGGFELALGPAATGRDYRIRRTAIKPWPACYHAQAPIEAAVRLRERVPVNELERIEVGTYQEAWRSIASEQEKWDPRTRETADHSLPYMVARALVDGSITVDSFAPGSYLDDSLRPLLGRIAAHADEAATAAYPDRIVARIVARDRAGRVHEVEVTNPTGHPANPMSPERLDAKVRGIAGDAAAGWADVASAGALGDLLDATF